MTGKSRPFKACGSGMPPPPGVTLEMWSGVCVHAFQSTNGAACPCSAAHTRVRSSVLRKCSGTRTRDTWNERGGGGGTKRSRAGRNGVWKGGEETGRGVMAGKCRKEEAPEILFFAAHTVAPSKSRCFLGRGSAR
eukprot:6191533-Pleurochrysis_carterae.AAC.9